jgi:flagellar biosynthetic protein FliR
MPVFSYAQIEGWLALGFWPFVRIGACLMVAPVFGAAYVPPRIRIVVALALTVLVLPIIPHPVGLTLLSADGVITTAQQLVIGIAMGFVMQLMFDALTLGGQLLANGMGLGFAYNVDPLRGVETPALGQLYTLLGSLTFLALDGHVALIQTLVATFNGLPVGPAGFSAAALQAIANWGSQMFLGALRVALAGITALIVVNLGFGVISRAAPAMNLFGVGFPITLIFGMVVLLLGLPTLQTAFTDMLSSAFTFVRALGGVP